jgi:hypothetical protein
VSIGQALDKNHEENWHTKLSNCNVLQIFFSLSLSHSLCLHASKGQSNGLHSVEHKVCVVRRKCKAMERILVGFWHEGT